MDTNRTHAAAEVRRLVKDFNEHPWDINNGRCDDFADQLIASLGPEAEAFGW